MGKYSDGYHFLSSYLTDSRRESLVNTLQQRTRYITVLLEDIYNPQNASAILRSCDCFGIQDVHLAEQRYGYKVHPNITRGADKWLNIKNHGSGTGTTARAIRSLQDSGYRVIATSPHAQALSIEDVAIEDGKIALVFGNEKDGISADTERYADGFACIPMAGFSESLNVSATVALCLHSLRTRMLRSDVYWSLTPQEYEFLLFDWARKSVKSADDLLRLKYENYHDLAADLYSEFPSFTTV